MCVPPHPYFGCKILVFLRLQTVCRRKIVKIKELTYKIFQDKELGVISTSAGGILAARRGRDDAGKAPEDYCAAKSRNNPQTIRAFCKITLLVQQQTARELTAQGAEVIVGDGAGNLGGWGAVCRTLLQPVGEGLEDRADQAAGGDQRVGN